jgi:nitroreductase
MGMDLFEAIADRRSVRDYTVQPVEDAVIDRLVRAAAAAPSAHNAQSWRFTIVRDRRLMDRLSDEAKAFRLATERLDERGRARMEDAAYHLLHRAPALILISAAEPSTWATENCALAAQNLMLAAFGLGLGSCWIGYVQAYLNTSEGKRLLGLDERWLSVAPIVVGYPASRPAPIPRNEPVVDWIG